MSVAQFRGGSGQEALHVAAEAVCEPADEYPFDAEPDPMTFDEHDFPEATPHLEFFNAR